MPKIDNLTLTAMAAKEAGMSYGQYVAKFGNTPDLSMKPAPSPGDKVCPICGEVFYPARYSRNRIYCSPQCAFDAQLMRRRRKNNAE